MKEISKSATRIVLILIILTLCVMMAIVVFRNSDKAEVVTGVIGAFTMVASSTVSFYFNKNNTANAASEFLKKSAQPEEKTASPVTQEPQGEA